MNYCGGNLVEEKDHMVDFLVAAIIQNTSIQVRKDLSNGG